MNRCLASLLALVILATSVFAEVAKPHIRVSAWYWLNSAPKSDWQGDFITMKNLGFTDVLLCWGLDLAGVTTRKTDTKQAMEYARQAGIGAYLIIWQPSANSLTRTPEFMQIGSDHKPRDTFDTFNPEWRATAWKTYLQDIAQTYGHEPAFSGYVFDDSFGSSDVAYGAYEEKTFGAPLPRHPGEPRWDEWTKARAGWWEDWAKDTVAYLRASDPDPRHEIYLEDTIGRFNNPNDQASIGLDFNRVARHFDAVGGYTTPIWTTNADSDAVVQRETIDAIQKVRALVGPEKQIVYTFWSANAGEEGNIGPARFPTAAQIRAVCEQALKLGVRHLDMYGYRIGQYSVTRAEMARMMPPEPAPYVLTGQFPGKFMWDRPEIHDELAAYLKSLQTK